MNEKDYNGFVSPSSRCEFDKMGGKKKKKKGDL